MAELKTRPTRKSAAKYLTGIANEARRKDCKQLLSMMQQVTGEKPVIWGDSIVGFGRYHYQQRSGQKATWPLTGFSPRKQNLVVYIMPGFSAFEKELKKLGKYKNSVSCLYLNNLQDIDFKVLTTIVKKSVIEMRKRYPEI